MGAVNMSNREPKKKLVDLWRSLHGVIWVLGIIILTSRGWWWPGILVLFAISAIYEGLLQHFAPEAYVEEEPEESAKPAGTIRIEPAPTFAPPAPQEHRIELLPQVCPNCNAPIRGHEVRWTGPQSANCAYCGSNLPMNKD